MIQIMPRKIIIFVEDYYEDLELQYPRLRLLEAGFAPVVAGPGRGNYKGKNGYPQKEDITFDALNARECSGVIVPGGWAPDRLRRSKQVLQFVREMDENGRLVASICHGPWVLVSAGILKNRKMTCVEAIKDDVVNAGAQFEDSESVVDRNLITARVPNDLPAFMKAILHFLS
ncbi:MAG: type 1 glutamine amidotransferase [Planctomycetes bacterium]|nr:type 1 glutamine amidotransferase [Planctomycetota bacterium]